MINCKSCGYSGAYEGKRCPECGAPYTLTESEVRRILDDTHRAKETKEMETVAENYRMLADFGIPEAQREYGRLLETEGEYVRANALYRLAAEAGDALAAYRFAIRNIELNDDGRRFWLSYASILGCKESFSATADAMSEIGKEHIADYYYRHAAACDDVGAIVTLSRRYAEGLGCEKNEGYAKWFMDKLTLPPIHAIRLAYRLRGVEAVEPPIPTCDFYDDHLRALAAEAERFGFFGARLFLVELLAERGDVGAWLELSHLYLEGIGTEVRVDEGLAALRTAATSGSAEAYRLLGDAYLVGEYVSADIDEALRSYSRAVELGDGVSALRLGTLYEEGDGVEENPAYAITLYEEGARLGCEEAAHRAERLKDRREELYRAGLTYRSSDPEAAFRYFATAAHMGYAPAEVKLGDCYLFGIGTRVDRRRAYLWYRNAVRRGETEALYPLALCYSRGAGTAFHYRRAVSTLKLAVAHGCENADRELKRLYRNRLKKSMRQLFSNAMRLVYQHKYDEAYRLFSVLARMEEGQAVYALGMCYEFGIGTEVDRSRAYSYYGRAVDLGFIDKRAHDKAMFLKMIR